MKGDPIMVECDNCGVGHRWIPREVEIEMAGLQARVAELEKEMGNLKSAAAAQAVPRPAVLRGFLRDSAERLGGVR